MAYHIKLVNVDNDEVHLLVHSKPKYSTLKELASTLGGYLRKESLKDLVVYIGIEELPSPLRGEATVIIRSSQQVIIRGDSKVLEELSDLKKRRLVIEIEDTRGSCDSLLRYFDINRRGTYNVYRYFEHARKLLANIGISREEFYSNRIAVELSNNVKADQKILAKALVDSHLMVDRHLYELDLDGLADSLYSTEIFLETYGYRSEKLRPLKIGGFVLSEQCFPELYRVIKPRLKDLVPLYRNEMEVGEYRVWLDHYSLAVLFPTWLTPVEFYEFVKTKLNSLLEALSVKYPVWEKLKIKPGDNVFSVTEKLLHALEQIGLGNLKHTIRKAPVLEFEEGVLKICVNEIHRDKLVKLRGAKDVLEARLGIKLLLDIAKRENDTYYC